MMIPGSVLLKHINALEGAATKIANLQRPGAAALTNFEASGIGVTLGEAASVIKELGVTQAHTGVAIANDAQKFFASADDLVKGANTFKPGNLDRVVGHVEEGISNLRGRLRYTPFD